MSKTPEILVTCDLCGTPNIFANKLAQHQKTKNCASRLESAARAILLANPHTPRPALAKGKPAGTPLTLARLDVMPALPAPADDGWANARHYAQMAEGGTQVVIVAQIMCGFELIELQKRFGLGRGGDRKSKPNDSVLKWPDLVKEKIGRSDDTARNWMNMAKAVQPRLKKLDGPWEAPSLLALPPSEWPEGARDAVAKTLKHVCDGETQSDWMAELGLIKKGDGRSKNPGGFRPNALILRAWLAENYPQYPEYLDLDTFTALPAEVQKRFKAEGQRYEERMTKEQRAQLEHEADRRAWLAQITPAVTLGIDQEFYLADTEAEFIQLRELQTALNDLRSLVDAALGGKAPKKALRSK